MRAALIAACLICCLPITVFAQKVNKIACYANRKPNPAFKKKLWNGYEISLGPSRAPTDGDDCTAAIYNAAGKVVFRTTGFNVIFDEDGTGEDFDGDGKPEVVFETDTGGGNHCCWGYDVVSLFPKPHRLFSVDGSARFEKNKGGGVVIWTRSPGPYGYTSMASTPFADKVFHVRKGQLADVTPAYCGKIATDMNADYRYQQRLLTPENIARLQSKKIEDPEKIAWSNSVDDEEIVSALLSRALQHVFCREFDQAMKDLDLWPETSRAKMKGDFAEAIKREYPAFAAQLVQSER